MPAPLKSLLTGLTLGLGLLRAVTLVDGAHSSSHEIIRREDGHYEAREVLSGQESERRRELAKRQSVGVGGAGVGLAGANAGVGNVTLKIGNIRVHTGNLLLDTIHIGDITVLVSAGVGKRDLEPAQTPLPGLPSISGLPSFAPGQIPEGPVEAVIVAGDKTVIYTPPSEPTSAPSPSSSSADVTSSSNDAASVSPTTPPSSVVRGAVAVVTASPQVHELAKRQSVSVAPVSASVGPIGVGIGNVNVSVGDINVELGDITIKNVTIGNVLVSVKINAQHAIETLIGDVSSLVSGVTGILPSVTGAVSSIVSDASSIVSSLTATATSASSSSTGAAAERIVAHTAPTGFVRPRKEKI